MGVWGSGFRVTIESYYNVAVFIVRSSCYELRGFQACGFKGGIQSGFLVSNETGSTHSAENIIPSEKDASSDS